MPRLAKKQLGQVDADLLRRVDEARGDVPRVRWVERALEAALRGSPEVVAPADRKSPEALPETARSEPASPRASEPAADLPKVAKRHWA